MKIFKIRLSTSDNCHESFYTLPKDIDLDENGFPVFNEEAVINLPQFRSFLKRTASPIVYLSYTLYEILNEVTSVSYQTLSQLEAEGKLSIIDQNDYPLFFKNGKLLENKGFFNRK